MDYNCNWRKRKLIFDKNIVLNTFLHYSDPESNKEHTIFGQESSGLFYNYEDRIQGWDCSKWLKGFELAKDQAPVRSARFYEIALSYFHDSPCDLKHVVKGCNRSSGFYYLIFGYTYEGNE